jgi:hypothetical protein
MNEIQRKTKIQRPKRNHRTTVLEKTNKIQSILKSQLAQIDQNLFNQKSKIHVLSKS